MVVSDRCRTQRVRDMSARLLPADWGADGGVRSLKSLVYFPKGEPSSPGRALAARRALAIPGAERPGSARVPGMSVPVQTLPRVALRAPEGIVQAIRGLPVH